MLGAGLGFSLGLRYLADGWSRRKVVALFIAKSCAGKRWRPGATPTLAHLLSQALMSMYRYDAHGHGPVLAISTQRCCSHIDISRLFPSQQIRGSTSISYRNVHTFVKFQRIFLEL
jgi:hypothetical protein